MAYQSHFIAIQQPAHFLYTQSVKGHSMGYGSNSDTATVIKIGGMRRLYLAVGFALAIKYPTLV